MKLGSVWLVPRLAPIRHAGVASQAQAAAPVPTLPNCELRSWRTLACQWCAARRPDSPSASASMSRALTLKGWPGRPTRSLVRSSSASAVPSGVVMVFSQPS